LAEYILKYESQRQFTTKKEMDDFVRSQNIKIIRARKCCKYHYVEGRVIRFKSKTVRVMF